MPSHEQRYFKRIQFVVDIEVEYQDKVFTGDLLDLSLKGALIAFPNELPITTQEECIVRIHLPSSQIILVFDSRLVHLQGRHYGFQFIGQDDVTIGHLRRLLELNLGDETEVEHELFFLLSPPEEQ